MRLGDFILASREPILVEWEALAERCAPVSGAMDVTALRDHARNMLAAIAAEFAMPRSGIAPPAQIELIEPFDQAIERESHVYVRVPSGDPTRLVPAVRSIVRDLDPELPIVDAVVVEDVVADTMARDRVLMVVLGSFSVVAPVLALVGVYGVTAGVARQRLPEFGLRLALGARVRDPAPGGVGSEGRPSPAPS